MSISPVLQELREATSAAHEAIETEANVEPRLRDLTERPAMVARFHVLHRAVEAAVAPWRAAFEAEGYAPESHSILIGEDLVRLGVSAPAGAAMDPLPTFGEAVGWVYVAEGSMLGGRVMRKAMTRDGIPLDGLEFLDPWGDETGSRWRAFMHAMDSACASGRATRKDVVRGGRDAFDLAFKVLVSPPGERA